MAAENTKRMLSVASKKASRVKEKLAQKILHVDSTTDEGFSMFVSNYNKQQTAAKKLQKELLRYVTAVKGLGGAAKSLSEVLVEIYETDWDGSEQFKTFADQRNLLWDDLSNHLNSDVVGPVNDYLGKFPDVQKKIEKRDRKLTDHDMTKREFEKLKTKDAAKAKGQDQKMQHAEEKYTQAKQLYDEIADELYKELPMLYDSRIEFVAKLYDSLSRHEAQFHSQVFQIEEKILELTAKLAAEAASGVHSTKRERDAGPSTWSRPDYQDASSEGGDTHSLTEQKTAAGGEGITPVASDTTLPSPGVGGGEATPSPPTPVVQSPTRSSPLPHKSEASPKPASPEPSASSTMQSSQARPPKPTRTSTSSLVGERQERSPDRSSTEVTAPLPIASKSIPEVVQSVSEPGEVATAEHGRESDHQTGVAGSGEEAPLTLKVEPADVPVNTEPSPSVPPINATPSEASAPAETTPIRAPPSSDNSLAGGEEGHKNETPQDEGEPMTVLYKVIAAHPYKGEDEDELTFEKGTTILVIPYDDPEEEEDGWKMGFIPGTQKKGIFPENFTKPLPNQ